MFIVLKKVNQTEFIGGITTRTLLSAVIGTKQSNK
ncbi:Uncharacterised protein [Budvicia aquatica]|uniref:Uncharacterized protein n=1 Tax=Budvicia aquatica TaxID=82979 RepID=A0A484ZEK7_9GAMM|nr:Uncharacterised protein [Budvicia aquatica]